MKKTSIAIITLCVISFASCKKDRTCECTDTSSGSSSASTSTTRTITYKKIKKSDAKDACLSYSQDYTYASGSSNSSNTYKSDCKLK